MGEMPQPGYISEALVAAAARGGASDIDSTSQKMSPPPQEDIAGEIYRGNYRSRSLEGLCLGGNWRYIAGVLYRRNYKTRI